MTKLGTIESTLFVPMLGRIYASEFWAIGQKVLMKIAMRIENSMSMAI